MKNTLFILLLILSKSISLAEAQSYYDNLNKFQTRLEYNIDTNNFILFETKKIQHLLTSNNLRETGPNKNELSLMMRSLVMNGILHASQNSIDLEGLYKYYSADQFKLKDNAKKHRFICFATSLSAAVLLTGKKIGMADLDRIFGKESNEKKSQMINDLVKISSNVSKMKEFNDAYRDLEPKIREKLTQRKKDIIRETNDYVNNLNSLQKRNFDQKFKIAQLDNKIRELNNRIRYYARLSLLLGTHKNKEDINAISDLRDRLKSMQEYASSEYDSLKDEAAQLQNQISKVLSFLQIEKIAKKVEDRSASYIINPQSSESLYDEIFNRAQRLIAAHESSLAEQTLYYVNDLRVPDVRIGETFSSDFLTTNLIKQKYNEFINQRDNAHLTIDKIINYFDEIFPQDHYGNRRALDSTHPKHLDPGALIDFSYAEYNSSGELISGRIQIEDARASLIALKGVIEGREDDFKTVRLRYAVKRALKYLEENGNDQQVKNNILLVLVSAGKHCIDGKDHGAQTILNIIYKGGIDPILKGKSSKTIQSVVDEIAFNLREKVFRNVISFAGDTETGATNATYRFAYADLLKITPAEMPMHQLGRGPQRLLNNGYYLHIPDYKNLSDEDFFKRFYDGKKAQQPLGLWNSPEDKRSHEGYTPTQLMLAMLREINSNDEFYQIASDYLRKYVADNRDYFTKNFLTKNYTVLDDNGKSITLVQKLYSDIMFDDEVTYEDSIKVVKDNYSSYSESIYQYIYEPRFLEDGKQHVAALNLQALRLLLVLTGHLIAM